MHTCTQRLFRLVVCSIRHAKVFVLLLTKQKWSWYIHTYIKRERKIVFLKTKKQKESKEKDRLPNWT
jgi:hypothetical protein